MLKTTRCSSGGPKAVTRDQARKAYIEAAQLGVLIDDAAVRVRGITDALIVDEMHSEVGISHLAAATEELLDAVNEISETFAEQERSKSPEVIEIRRAFDRMKTPA